MAQVTILHEGDHSLILGSASLHSPDGIIQASIALNGIADGDDGRHTGINRTADADWGSIVAVILGVRETAVTIPAVVIALVDAIESFVLALCLDSHVTATELGGTVRARNHLLPLPVGRSLDQHGIQGSSADSAHHETAGEGSTHTILTQRQGDGGVVVFTVNIIGTAGNTAAADGHNTGSGVIRSSSDAVERGSRENAVHSNILGGNGAAVDSDCASECIHTVTFDAIDGTAVDG